MHVSQKRVCSRIVKTGKERVSAQVVRGTEEREGIEHSIHDDTERGFQVYLATDSDIASQSEKVLGDFAGHDCSHSSGSCYHVHVSPHLATMQHWFPLPPMPGRLRDLLKGPGHEPGNCNRPQSFVEFDR